MPATKKAKSVKDTGKAAKAMVDPRDAVITLIDAYYRIQETRKALDLCEQAMCRDEIVMKPGKDGKQAKHAGHIIGTVNGTLKLKNAEGKEKTIKRDEIATIRNRRFGTVEHARAALFNFSIGKRMVDISSPPLLQMETDIKTQLRKYLKGWNVWEEWLKDVKGCGEITAAALWALVDIEKAKRVSNLWSFAGHGLDSEGRPQRLQKGVKRNWCNRLKTVIWNCGESMVKRGAGYRELYDRFKEDEIRNRFTEVAADQTAGYLLAEPIGKHKVGYYVSDGAAAARIAKLVGNRMVKVERKPGHVNSRAKRRMRKVFLAHVWQVWREKDGLPVEPVYILAKSPDHVTEIPVVKE